MTIGRPDPSEYPGFNPRYVSLVPAGADILAILAGQPAEFDRVAARISPEAELFRYQPGKWSVREVVGHVGDTERIFGYRALCLARGDRTPLPGFDENAYTAAAGDHARRLSDLVAGFAAARRANLCVLDTLSADLWRSAGIVSGHPASVRAIAYLMAGHVLHHVAILQERYGIA